MFGETQGTTYRIILAEEDANFSKVEIDSLLNQFDSSLSTYIDTSVISQLNSAQSEISIPDKTGFFKACYQKSVELFQVTGGAFDPSVFPLVKGWGFMDNMEEPLTKMEIDSILKFVGFGKLHTVAFEDPVIHLRKSHSGYKLDFNAIAQGYSVDVLHDFLKKKGHENFFVEIGGEIRVSGVNREGNKWRIGVDTPKDSLEERVLENIIYLSDKAIATSGNYRKFYIRDGVKYAHTLDPKTGFPVQHSLLSATVIAGNCASADAFATAFMVMGAEKSIDFVEKYPELNIDIYLLEADASGGIKRWMSKGFEQFLK